LLRLEKKVKLFQLGLLPKLVVKFAQIPSGDAGDKERLRLEGYLYGKTC
jgi:hypothetical protein